MSDYLWPTFLRLFLVVIAQVLIFNHFFFVLGGQPVGLIFLYPLVILSLPITISRSWIVIGGFLLGLLIDLFSGSMGVHASAMVASAFMRALILKLLEPRGGYKINQIPSPFYFGVLWYLKYIFWMFGIHCIVYFMAQVFDLTDLHIILLRAVFSMISSTATILLLMIVLNPQR